MLLEEARDNQLDRPCRCGGDMRLAAVIPGLSSELAHRVFECVQCGRLAWLAEAEEQTS